MSNFDWVRELSSCSLPPIFEKLKLEVEEDIKTRMALRREGDAYGFEMARTVDAFTVYLNSNHRREAVKFTLKEKCIEVSDSSGDQMFEATLTLNDEGECRVKIDGQERELWHMRRLALEGLFFDFYRPSIMPSISQK
jgi:hypothetical protein